VEAQPLQQPEQVGAPFSATLLETAFPFAEVSGVARQDRYSRDHVYAIHKWWARRPPAVIRALLLAVALGPDTPLKEFWKHFASSTDALAGRHVGDVFMGGATTCVEAGRLGAKVTGIDVDPLAVRIARAELTQLDHEEFECHAASLHAYLVRRHGDLYPSGRPKTTDATPLHYFWLRRADCPDCGESSLLYRNLYLVRDRGRAGAVVRDDAATAFCPDCLRLHPLPSGRKEIRCCARRRKLEDGTFRRGAFECPACGARAMNEELKVGALPRVLVAVEETLTEGRRMLRRSTPADADALQTARRRRSARTAQLPAASLAGIDSGRPASYGFKTVADLFSDRQLVVLSEAFAWVRRCDLAEPLRNALLLAVSNAIGANNLLCGYATDYGRLSALFSGVRAYSMPVLSVELNPLHRTAGRATIARTLARAARAQSETVMRHAFVPASGSIEQHSFAVAASVDHAVSCQSADRPVESRFGKFDLVLTDPPYFDFIPYSDLSLLYRAWFTPGARAERLGGRPIYPVGEDAVSEFATRLGIAFRRAREALADGAPLVFTFHSAHANAWRALGDALERAGLRVTAVYPVWADGRAGGHGHIGNCEWDLVFVCRPKTALASPVTVSLDDWLAALSGETIEASDICSMEFGLAMAKRLGA
jgi:adenine-specific DNA methylase